MDDKLKILLNSKKNINTVNVDTFTKLSLSNRKSKINEYDVKSVLSVTELFELEREENEIYRIYGGLEYVSLLDGLINNYSEFKDFFRPERNDSKNIYNSFDFYLVKPSDEDYPNIDYTIGSSINIENDDISYGLDNPTLNFSTTIYRRSFSVLTKLENFELFNAGYQKNIFKNQKYQYVFNIDIDISSLVDGLGMPLTELYIYAQYKPTTNEEISFEKWNNSGQMSKVNFIPKQFNIGDVVETNSNAIIGDLVEFSRPRFFQRQDTQQTFRITTPITNPNRDIVWRYNPFIPIRLRYFEDYLNTVNKNSDSYEDLNRIPEYAFELSNGDMVWKNIMPEGFIDPLTGLGTNHPFVNKRRYLFADVILDIYPDLNDSTTRSAFENIWFDKNTIPLNTLPTTNIGDINRPC
ncbi:MAG: hypothetical protein ACOC22_00465 [bacterium]